MVKNLLDFCVNSWEALNKTRNGNCLLMIVMTFLICNFISYRFWLNCLCICTIRNMWNLFTIISFSQISKLKEELLIFAHLSQMLKWALLLKIWSFALSSLSFHIFIFSLIIESILTKHTKHPRWKDFQVSSNEGSGPL